MFLTRTPRSHTQALASDFATIARIEATLAHDTKQRVAQDAPDFSRLKRYIPNLKV